MPVAEVNTMYHHIQTHSSTALTIAVTIWAACPSLRAPLPPLCLQVDKIVVNLERLLRPPPLCIHPLSLPPPLHQGGRGGRLPGEASRRPVRRQGRPSSRGCEWMGAGTQSSLARCRGIQSSLARCRQSRSAWGMHSVSVLGAHRVADVPLGSQVHSSAAAVFLAHHDLFVPQLRLLSLLPTPPPPPTLLPPDPPRWGGTMAS